MMMTVYFLVEIITTHTYTHEYKKFFLLGQTVTTHHNSYIQETISNLPHGACIFIP